MAGRTLTRASFAAARKFLLERARPLEASLYLFHFEGGSAESVLRSLSAFQNEDGGFGRGLEPDLRAAESSAICTSIALQGMRDVGAVREASPAARALAYLRETLDRGFDGWRIVPAVVEASPHAPWWNQTGREHGFDAFSLNPTAELLGYCYERPEVVAPADVERVAAAVSSALPAREVLEMHDLLCCLRLFASPGLPDALAKRLRETLDRSVAKAVLRDPEEWKGYGLRPLQVADHASSPFFPALAEAVAENLDFEIATQEADRSWAPTWTWGDAYPEAWPAARRDWSGVLTLQRLLMLRRFGRLNP